VLVDLGGRRTELTSSRALPVAVLFERVGFGGRPVHRRSWQQRWQQPRIVSLGRAGASASRPGPAL